MSRLSLAATGLILVATAPASLAAQEALEAQTGKPPERIDIRVDTTPENEAYEDCEQDQDAATITGEIIVCRKQTGGENRLYSKEEAERRHAERTKYRDDPLAPDFISDCHDQGWPVGCFKAGSVPPPVLLIDLDAIPETPAGSDADRVGRGLAPRGHMTTPSGAVLVAGDTGLQDNAEELGLPPPPARESELSPSGSASPKAEPSG